MCGPRVRAPCEVVGRLASGGEGMDEAASCARRPKGSGSSRGRRRRRPGPATGPVRAAPALLTDRRARRHAGVDDAAGTRVAAGLSVFLRPSVPPSFHLRGQSGGQATGGGGAGRTVEALPSLRFRPGPPPWASAPGPAPRAGLRPRVQRMPGRGRPGAGEVRGTAWESRAEPGASGTWSDEEPGAPGLDRDGPGSGVTESPVPASARGQDKGIGNRRPDDHIFSGSPPRALPGRDAGAGGGGAASFTGPAGSFPFSAQRGRGVGVGVGAHVERGEGCGQAPSRGPDLTLRTEVETNGRH